MTVRAPALLVLLVATGCSSPEPSAPEPAAPAPKPAPPTRAGLELAAYLGDADARRALKREAWPRDENPARWARGLSRWNAEVMTRVAVALGRSALPHSSLAESKAGLESLEAWLRCPCPDHHAKAVTACDRLEPAIEGLLKKTPASAELDAWELDVKASTLVWSCTFFFQLATGTNERRTRSQLGTLVGEAVGLEASRLPADLSALDPKSAGEILGALAGGGHGGGRLSPKARAAWKEVSANLAKRAKAAGVIVRGKLRAVLVPWALDPTSNVPDGALQRVDAEDEAYKKRREARRKRRGR